MKKLILLLSLATILLTGCIEYGITVKVNENGSGEIVEEFLIKKQAFNLINLSFPNNDLINNAEEELLSRSRNFGDSVVVKSSEKLNYDKQRGYRTVYKFNDISNVKINSDTFNHAINNLKIQSDEGVVDSNKHNQLGFSFSKLDSEGSNEIIIVNDFARLLKLSQKAYENRNKEQKKAMEDIQKGISDNQDQVNDQLQFMKVFAEGMKFYVSLEFENNIKESNIDYSGNKIDLFSFEFDKMLDDSDNIVKLISSPVFSFEALIRLAKDMEGCTFQDSEIIKIKQ